MSGFRPGDMDPRLREAYAIALGAFAELVRLAEYEPGGCSHLAIDAVKTLCGRKPVRVGQPLGLELTLELGARLGLCGTCRRRAQTCAADTATLSTYRKVTEAIG